MINKIEYSDSNDLISQIFRNESGKIVSTLTRVLGIKNFDLAEELVQEAILSALNSWKINGIPPNPVSWLYKVAKNKAIDLIRRQKKFNEITEEIKNESILYAFHLEDYLDKIFYDDQIKDNQLRMIFFCCHPSINFESQISLTLKVLCGFNTKEIANAFFTNEETIQKRLYRAKQKMKNENISFEIPATKDLKSRIYIVNKIIYLLFNEGYNSTQSDILIRKDLCEEAIMLCHLLNDNPILKNSDSYALLALMYFQASRFESRLDNQGNIILLEQQDRSLWDKSMINQGLIFFSKSFSDEYLSQYHLEAGIALQHSIAENFEETDWNNILILYDKIISQNNSPIILLNRAIVIWKLYDANQAIKEIDKIENTKILDSYYLYHATLGSLHFELKNNQTSKEYFLKAISLTSSNSEKKLLYKKIEAIK